MGTRHRLTAELAVAVAVLGVGAGCSSAERKRTDADQKPLDHLAPGEAVEGKEQVHGLPLPRLSQIAARLASSTHVTSQLSPEELINFLRARVKEGTVTTGASSTTLVNVIPRNDANKRLTIEVRVARAGDGTRSEMIIRDTTPAPVEPGLSDEQRMKKAGLTPDGKIADPTHLE